MPPIPAFVLTVGFYGAVSSTYLGVRTFPHTLYCASSFPFRNLLIKRVAPGELARTVYSALQVLVVFYCKVPPGESPGLTAGGFVVTGKGLRGAFCPAQYDNLWRILCTTSQGGYRDGQHTSTR